MSSKQAGFPRSIQIFGEHLCSCKILAESIVEELDYTLLLTPSEVSNPFPCEGAELEHQLYTLRDNLDMIRYTQPFAGYVADFALLDHVYIDLSFELRSHVNPNRRELFRWIRTQFLRDVEPPDLLIHLHEFDDKSREEFLRRTWKGPLIKVERGIDMVDDVISIIKEGI